MKTIPAVLLLSTALSLSACGQIGQQWLDPDKTFALFDQPTIKGVSETQEDMAKEAVAAGDYARAAQIYQQLIATASAKTTPEQLLRYKLAMADCTRRTGNTEDALNMYEEIFKQYPTNLDIAEGRALTMMAAGKPTDAGRAFSDIIEKDPKRWRSLNALGILFVTKNMVPEAMAYYTEALNQSPDNAAILNNVGLSYATDRNFPRAFEALQQASRVSKIPSQRKQIDLNLAMVYGVSGDLDTSRDIASKYLEGPALDNNLGLYAHLAKDDALAKSYLNMALSQSPTYYERAWENLDVVNDSNRSDSTDPKPLEPAKPAADAKLPALDAVTAPAPASNKKSKWKKTRGQPHAEAPARAEIAKTQDAEPAADVKLPVDAAAKAAATQADAADMPTRPAIAAEEPKADPGPAVSIESKAALSAPINASGTIAPPAALKADGPFITPTPSVTKVE